MLLLKSLLAWASILLLAVANGVLREAVLVPSLGSKNGLLVSGVLLCLCVALVACLLALLSKKMTVRQSLLVGALWLFLTLTFEFSFGRYVQQKSWPEMFAAYTFKAFKDGNLWPVVLLTTLLAPYLATLAQAGRRQAKRGGSQETP